MSLLQTLWQRDGAQPVAFGPQGEVTLAELRRASLQLARAMARHESAGQPGARWALCFDDSLLFAQALLACALGGYQAVLPGHQRLAGLQELQAQFDGLLTDAELPGAALPVPQLRLPLADAHAGLDTAHGDLAPERLDITLFSSGSTGEPKAIPKAWPQLEAELRVQMALWGERMAGTRVLASVSHQHIYGLLFRILLPLALGRPFDRRTIDYPEQLATQGAPWCLIASPAFLSRLDPAMPATGCRLIVSSGGPLQLEDARQARLLLGQLPVEIFGSSETGGIGWRQRHREQTPWTALPGVEVRVSPDQGLLLRSPFLEENDWLACADRIALHEEGFELLGRQDRIVKLEEKRISLDEVEARLQALAEVESAAVLALQQGHRQILGAVLVLSELGAARWDELGQGRFLLALRQQLRPWLEPVALPRSVRRVAHMPVNAQGKRPWPLLKELFDEPAR
ncbi:acyl-CoA synthetase [Aeromonas taiwanensis]|uniref:Acyl-CoA synthetase n=1 Tax=Aeromonas taiwanensis TaxID=633417 RepID=A0A5F0K9A6_9GAMM|nr:AMP-binding protein [Aeromonas taiwanensis]TFF74317.1 acyl-CoA synthetase [Aeromonas taiwanensis]TFF75116.1 acyl-CoA synthetase [Aeromonas taiwanensis]TFF78534.1 acyl-CoA synthetase [Aeromonas taiwanensis]